MARIRIPNGWAHVLDGELDKPYFRALEQFLDEERAAHQVLPPEDQVLAALETTPYEAVRVVLLGQDPYPTPGHAHGLCFSVQPGVKLPGSLRNIYKELHDDLGVPPATTGCLLPWARQGVLLLNAVLTVRAGEANSHARKGWETFTDAVVDAIARRPEPVVFALWGNHAQKKGARLDGSHHVVIRGAHPSPLSAKLWFGSRPFSQIDAALRGIGRDPVHWRL
jgi:uracil-DNA glycosylase